MKLHLSKSKNSCSLYVTKSYREGKKTTTKIVEKLGTYDELKIKLNGEDPIEWAKQYIKELTAKEKEENKKINISYSPTKQLEKSDQTAYNCGYLFLQKIYHELGLHKISKAISSKYKFEYDLNSILSRLIYSRILFPASKLSTFEDSKQFIEQSDFDLHQIYRALDVLAKESNFIQSAVYKNSIKTMNRNSKVIYYDCTNYFFESEQACGIRQYGVSKEHRPSPIVQMGLFMDADGIPLAFDINPGNTNEQITLQPLEKRLSADFDLSNLVVCTDAGLSSTDNRKFNNAPGRHFITTQSLKKIKLHLKQWALDSSNWRILGSNVEYNINELNENTDYSKTTFYKERWINEDGIEQRLIVTYSLKYKAFTERKRAEQIERALNKVNHNPSQIESKGNADYKRFISKTTCTKDGEIAELNSYDIDYNKIAEEQQYDGFYAICTNLQDDVAEIIKVNHRRWEIEESFRIMKTDFKARPVYLQKDERIKAHFLTCFLSLLIYRILETKLHSLHTCENIIKTLSTMQMFKSPGDGYIPIYTRTTLTDHLHVFLGFRTDYQIIPIKNLKKIISTTKR